MDATYNIDTNPRQGLLAVTLVGFLTWDDFQQLRHDVARSIAEIGCSPGQHLALWDIKNAKIQSQDIVRGLRAMSDKGAVAARRIAVVAGESLMRMQLRRLIGEERELQTFDTELEARMWLLKPGNGLPARAWSNAGGTATGTTQILAMDRATP